MKKIYLVLSMLATAGGLMAAPLFPEPGPRAKFIDLSWSNPTVDSYVKDLKTLERCAPVDGLVIRVYGKPRKVNGKMFRPGSGTSMGKIPWKYEDFTDAIAKLKQTGSSKFTDNFFYTTASPGDADWFSDADWASVVNNYAIATRVAKETGMKGLVVDIEEYGKKFWNYQPCQGKHSYADARRIARQRGQEWGRAVFSAYPEGTYFFLHFLNYAGSGSSLAGPFLDGMYDVIPPQSVIIDGQEALGYGARRADDYDLIFRMAHRTHVLHLSPENRRKHRMQTRLAPAFYLDAIFVQDSRSRYHRRLQPEVDHGALKFYCTNLLNAVGRAEGYIWLYGEKGAWWKSSHPQVKMTWEQRVPGITQITELVHDPNGFPLEKLNAKNLLQNSRWSYWQLQDDQKKGTPKPGRSSNKDGILQASGTTNGCFFQNIPVKPGGIYLYRADCRIEKMLTGKGSLSVCYRDAKNQWLDVRQGTVFNPADSGQWTTGTMLFVVPENAAAASIQLVVHGQRPQDTMSFRNMVLIQVFK